MKPTLRSIRYLALAAILTLASPVIRAQTFTGQATLTDTPSALRVIIHPISSESRLRICYEHTGGGTVQVQLLQRDMVLYDEYSAKPTAVANLDLASLPAGEYTIRVQAYNARYRQVIRLDPPAGRLITLIDELPVPVGGTGNTLVKQ